MVSLIIFPTQQEYGVLWTNLYNCSHRIDMSRHDTKHHPNAFHYRSFIDCLSNASIFVPFGLVDAKLSLFLVLMPLYVFCPWWSSKGFVITPLLWMYTNTSMIVRPSNSRNLWGYVEIRDFDVCLLWVQMYILVCDPNNRDASLNQSSFRSGTHSIGRIWVDRDVHDTKYAQIVIHYSWYSTCCTWKGWTGLKEFSFVVAATSHKLWLYPTIDWTHYIIFIKITSIRDSHEPKNVPMRAVDPLVVEEPSWHSSLLRCSCTPSILRYVRIRE